VVLVLESIVSVVVTGVAAVMLAGVGIEQVGGVMPPGGLTIVQLSATDPVNPFDGVMVIVDVLPVVAPGLTAILPLLLSAKVGVALATAASIPRV
jgi:hypothetical protein